MVIAARGREQRAGKRADRRRKAEAVAIERLGRRQARHLQVHVPDHRRRIQAVVEVGLFIKYARAGAPEIPPEAEHDPDDRPLAFAY